MMKKRRVSHDIRSVVLFVQPFCTAEAAFAYINISDSGRVFKRNRLIFSAFSAGGLNRKWNIFNYPVIYESRELMYDKAEDRGSGRKKEKSNG